MANTGMLSVLMDCPSHTTFMLCFQQILIMLVSVYTMRVVLNTLEAELRN
jgi:hypothetical protein